MANQINADLLKSMRIDIDAALKAIGTKHGVSVRLGNGTFTADAASFKLHVNRIGDDGIGAGGVVTKEQSDLKRYAFMHRLTDAHLTQEFVAGTHRFVLVGYRNKASKKPFLCKSLTDGKTYILTEEQVHKGLGIEKPKMIITQLTHIPTT